MNPRIPVLGLLAQLPLYALKLTGLLSWSWWAVTFPVWGAALFVAGFAAMFALLDLLFDRK